LTRPGQWFKPEPFDLFARADQLPRDGSDMPYGPNSKAVLDLFARLGSLSKTQIAAVGHRLDALPFGVAPARERLAWSVRPMLEQAIIRVGRADEAQRAFIDGTAVLTSAIAGDWPVAGLEWYWNDGSSRPAEAAGTLAAAVALADQLDPWIVTELEEPWRALECPAEDYFGSRTPEFSIYLGEVALMSGAQAEAWVAAWWNAPLPPRVFTRLGIIVAEIDRADPHREARVAAERLVRAEPEGWLWDRVAWRAGMVRRVQADNAFMNQLAIAGSGAGIARAFGYILPVSLRDELLSPFLVAFESAPSKLGSL